MLFLFMLAVLTAQPGVDEVLSRHIQALGGEAAATAVKSQVRRGMFHFDARGRGFAAEVRGVPGKVQFTLTEPGVFILEYVMNGSQGWLNDPDEIRDMSAKEAFDQRASLDYSVLFDIRRAYPELRVKGTERVNGHDAVAVECDNGAGSTTTAWFDAESGLLVRLGDDYFEDYRTVDGVKVPFTVRTKQARGGEQMLALREVVNNVAIDESLFEKDASVAAYRNAFRAMKTPALEKALAGLPVTPAQREALENLNGFAPEDGRILYDRVVGRGYRNALEIGTAFGNSALWIGMAMKKTGGKLITLEMDEARAKKAIETFRAAGLADVIECRVGDAFNTIPALEGRFDFVFMDTGTRLHKKFLDLVIDRVPEGGTISSHNANDMERAMPDFLNAIRTDARLESEIQKTAGGGFTFSLKKG